MKINVTNHAKIRWYERFINSGNINGDQIKDEIKYNFSSAELDYKQKDNIYIYKNDLTYFIVEEDNENNEQTIITVFPINEKIEATNYIQEQIKQVKRIDFNESFEIQVYKKVLNGELDKFPLRFWEDDKGGNLYIGAKECTKYMYENILNWNYADIVNKSKLNIFAKYKLRGMLYILFNNSWTMAIYNAYPNIKPYMIKSKGNKFNTYWKEDGVVKAIEMGKWLTEELRHDGYRFTSKSILSLKWDRIFIKYKLKSMLSIVFNNNLKDFFNIVFDANITEEDIARYDLNNYFNRNKFEEIHL